MARGRRDGYVMISIVAERYNIHPQTLRLYEREGLLSPARTVGNTRLYGPDELRQLEMILRLTRDLGVNLAGVEVVLDLCRRIEEIADDADAGEIVKIVRQAMLDRRVGLNRERALVKLGPRHVEKARKR
jgi:MerR family transcriptional regulator, heat shock protein HspR